MVARAVTLALVVALCACTHEPAPGESIAEVCRVENRKKTLTVSGYLVPPGLITGCTKSCTVYIAPRAGLREGVAATFPVGTGNNQMAAIDPLPSGPFPGEVKRLSARDFRVTDANGKVATPGDVIRATGSVWALELEGKIDCSMRVTSVQAL